VIIDTGTLNLIGLLASAGFAVVGYVLRGYTQPASTPSQTPVTTPATPASSPTPSASSSAPGPILGTVEQILAQIAHAQVVGPQQTQPTAAQLLVQLIAQLAAGNQVASAPATMAPAPAVAAAPVPAVAPAPAVAH
jgi:hypothetical protein